MESIVAGVFIAILGIVVLLGLLMMLGEAILFILPTLIAGGILGYFFL